tara:strand:- start:1788 stop:1970 length:183 start_codon:yes stop_codon:yes gene_type:complete
MDAMPALEDYTTTCRLPDADFGLITANVLADSKWLYNAIKEQIAKILTSIVGSSTGKCRF